MPNQLLKINCALEFDTMNTRVAIQLGTHIRYGADKKDQKDLNYEISAITTREDNHMTDITCVVSDKTLNVTETITSRLYIISTFNLHFFVQYKSYDNLNYKNSM